MIEPQNTMMPLPAGPTHAETPQGEGVGFGEMLAQSLGITSAIDPGGVQRIDSGNQPKQQFGDESAELATDETATSPVLDEDRRPAHSRFVALAGDSTVAVSASIMPDAVPDPAPVVDAGFVAELKPTVPLESDIDQGRTNPRPVNSLGEAHAVEPVDGQAKPTQARGPDLSISSTGQAVPTTGAVTGGDAIGLPVLDLEELATPVFATDGRVPAQPEVQGFLSPNGRPMTVGEPELVSADVPSRPAQSNLRAETPAGPLAASNGTTAGRNNDPSVVRPQPMPPQPLRLGSQRKTPVAPISKSELETAAVRSIDAAPDHVVLPVAAAPPRIDLSPEAPVRIDDPKAVKAAVAATPIVSEASAPSIAAPVSLSPLDALQIQTLTSDLTTSAAPVQYSALAERVMRAVEMQANQPPPRTLVVDIPEIEGLRLVVSVRAGAQVHVVPATGSSTPSTFQPFMDELSGLLADRGFLMTGDDRQPGRDPHQQEQQEVPSRRQRPTFRRAAPSDNDLRI